MTENNKIWSLIIRYLDNNLSKAESDKLESWMDEKTENRWTVNIVNQIWKASEDKSEDAIIRQLNLEEDWKKIEERIEDPVQKDQTVKIRQYRKARKRQKIFSTIWKVAALFLVASVSIFLTLQYSDSTEEMAYEPVFKEITTNPGERATITLGDGSLVTLNSDSKLITPDHFDRSERVVEVKGQAFFEIEKDQQRPFYVKTDRAVIEVIGTSFDVRSYESERNIRVVVRDGTVEMSAEDSASEALVLNSGYQGMFDRLETNLSIGRIENLDEYLGWMDGRLIFMNTPITEVLAHIERWYDVRIDTDQVSEQFLEKEFTADLKTRSVEDVMDVLSMSMNIDYEIDGDKVLIKNKP